MIDDNGRLLIKNCTLISFLICSSAISGTEIGVMGRVANEELGAPVDAFHAGVYASRDTFGMRANAVVAAFRANAEGSFDYPILGFNYLKEMSKYQDRDSVGLYADNASVPFKSWEIVNNVHYLPVSFSSGSIDTSNIKPGMVIDTNHNPKWSSFVVKVYKDRVITSGWVNTSTGKTGTPSDGIGLKINPVTKVWATNFNVFLRENGRAKSSVIQENGLINNNITNPSSINGIDTVVLPQSKYGGTAAYLARVADSGNTQQWQYGFMSQGSNINFISYSSTKHDPYAGFAETSKAKVGMVFSGRNQEASIIWKNGSRIVASTDPNGLIEKIGYKTDVVSGDSSLSDTFGRYVINGSGNVKLSLPLSDSLLDGYTLKLTNISNAAVELISRDGKTINGINSLKLPASRWNKEAIYINNQWVVE